MASETSAFNLIQLVETLQEQQAQHASAMELINRTLEQQQREHAEATAAITGTLEQISGLLSSLLGTSTQGGAKKASPATPPAATPAPVEKPATKPAAAPASRSSRGGYPQSGTESVLAFIKEQKNPTSADLAQHWKSEGRGGKVDKTLGNLVRAKSLKRTPIDGGRGSRYSLA